MLHGLDDGYHDEIRAVRSAGSFPLNALVTETRRNFD